MEERETSVASSSDFYGSDRKPDTPAHDAGHDSLPAKRKADELEPSNDKKRKIESVIPPPSPELNPCAGLPPAVWQHVFLFCPLKTLGRLLQVNRSFHSYLTAIRNVSNTKPDSGFLRLLKSESIWASARNMHPTKPPKPLPGFSEMQMWQLAWSTKCQFCNRTSSFTPGEKIWQRGPGETGVRIIWPFGVRACGPCLLERCQTDSSLLFSTASAVRPALPFAFITSDSNYIPAYTLQAATTPAAVEVIKYYYKPHVDDVTKELEHALSLGSAAAEEWSKGLEVRGKERMKVSENWERWEVKYEWWKSHQEPKREPSAAPSAAPSAVSTRSLSRRSPSRQAPSPVIHAPIPASKYQPVHPMAREGVPHPSFISIQPPGPPVTATASASPYFQPRPTTIPPQAFTPLPQPFAGAQPSRGERSLHDANEAKANRKLEIERRSQLLDPPIPPNVLRHMESFKAAIQISQPMNDYAWSMLQPRLLAQLPAALQAETDHASRLASLTTRTADRRQLDTNVKEVKEVLDREWEESQRPIRDRLSAIADDFINQDWDHGRAVTYENSPKFAADLLMYVRRKFYAEWGEVRASPTTQHGLSSENETTAGPRLVLDNMKWVYDNKVKPLTEQFRKELFLCYGSGCESNTRFYGFEGVIQHFGAKHTNAFSVGNVIVAWREAEWPEETPFHPDPISVKHAHAAHPGPNPYQGGYARGGTSTPHMQSHPLQQSPAPYGYGGQYNGPYAPPGVPPPPASGFDYSQQYGVPADNYFQQQMGPPGYVPNGSSHGYRTSPALAGAAMVHPLPTQPQVLGPSAVENLSGQQDYRTNLYDKQVSTIIEAGQEVWKQTSGIKDFPNSLRIYVLLHRVISKFHIEFNHEPNLKHFVDAFSNHEIPRALKNASGLSCKACQDELSYHSSLTYSTRSEERRTYTVLGLFSHFQSQHSVPVAHGYPNGRLPVHLDWKEDMIELPSERFISGLIHAPGMDDEKLHMIATVFPRLFPTPLPRIGTVDSNGVAAPAHGLSKDTHDAPRAGGASDFPMEKSAPSSLTSSYAASPKPPKPSEDEYDPLRPALLTQPNLAAREGSRLQAYHGSPPVDHRPRYYEEPRHYVGSNQRHNGHINGADVSSTQLSRGPTDGAYTSPRGYVELGPNPRRIRDMDLGSEGYPRRPIYRQDEPVYETGQRGIIYSQSGEGEHPHDYELLPRQVRYIEGDERRPEYRFARESRVRIGSPPARQTEADRFLEEFAAEQPLVDNAPKEQPVPRTAAKASLADADFDNGSHRTPPPLNIVSGDDQQDQGRSLSVMRHAAPSSASNGSRYEEHRSGGRQAPPSDANGPRRAGPHRRRDRQDHVPSRYYRYMSAAREEPYARGPSMGRGQSKRYERYEQQRRRIDQQETPAPRAGPEYAPAPAFSRDPSVDYPEDPYQAGPRALPAEYVPIQDRAYPYSPPRYRYAGSPEGPRGPPPVYVDEYGQPVHEYEIIRVPREPGPARGPYASARYYEDLDPSRLQYVPYERAPPRHSSRPNEYVYYDEREAPLSARRPTFQQEGETAYEAPPPPPPEIKVDAVPAVMPEGVDDMRYS